MPYEFETQEERIEKAKLKMQRFENLLGPRGGRSPNHGMTRGTST